MLILGAVIACCRLIGRVRGILILGDRDDPGPWRAAPAERNPSIDSRKSTFRCYAASLNAYVYGLLYGRSPCLFGSAGRRHLRLLVHAGEAVSKMWVFMWFGLGSGAAAGISLLSGALQRKLTRWFAGHSRPSILEGAPDRDRALRPAENWTCFSLYYS